MSHVPVLVLPKLNDSVDETDVKKDIDCKIKSRNENLV